jgi:hypothetical protein
LTARRAIEYLNTHPSDRIDCEREEDMPLLLRKYKLASGMMQEERIDDPDRIDRYLRLFEKDDVKKLEAGQKVFIEKDEWQLLP